MSNRYVILVVLAAGTVIGSPHSWAEEADTEPDPPPPKTRRIYSERATLYDPKASPSKSDSTTTIRIPMPTAPVDSGGGLMDDLGTSPMPAMAPAPNRPPPTREDDKKNRNWSAPSPEKPDASSGWGWLADDLMRTLQATSAQDRVDGRDEMTRDPFARDQDEEAGRRETEQDAASPSALERTDDRPSSTLTEEEMVQAKLKEMSSESAPEGWRPVGMDNDDRGWNPAGVTGERERSGGMADQIRTAYEAPVLEDPTRRWSGPGENLARVEPESVAREPRRDASLFRAPSEPGTFSASALGRASRTETRSTSLFDAPSTAPGAGSSGFGFSAPSPVFGSMSAVDIQPSLGSGSSLAPALPVSSSSATTPSLGGMGSEMESRPKTLPW